MSGPHFVSYQALFHLHTFSSNTHTHTHTHIHSCARSLSLSLSGTLASCSLCMESSLPRYHSACSLTSSNLSFSMRTILNTLNIPYPYLCFFYSSYHPTAYYTMCLFITSRFLYPSTQHPSPKPAPPHLPQHVNSTRVGIFLYFVH